MRLTQTFNSALGALGTNKVRTFLTMLGVVIGVFSVVSLTSLVKGVENFIVERFNSLGTNLVFVSPGATAFGNDPAAAFSANKLSEKHVDLVREYAGESLVAVSPSIRTGKTLKYKNNKHYTTISGMNHLGLELSNVEVAEGRFFTRGEEYIKDRVVILGTTVRDELFNGGNALGKRIKIDDVSFTVIGVLDEKNRAVNDRVLIPYTSIKDSLGIKQISGIATKVKDGVDIEKASKQIEFSMLHDLKDSDFTVFSQKDVLDSVGQILDVLSAGLAAIAGISLLVGGIGIMNIMLVSVTERIQEIGLRKALGATKGNIATQFLVEAIFISVVGGAAGLLMGWLLTLGLSSFLNAQIPWWSVLLALGFSVLVGIIFGTYPAVQAAKKEPIEALRYE